MTQVGGDLLRRVVGLTEQARMPIAVEDEDRATVVDFVVAVFVRLLVVIGDAVTLAESGELRRITAQSDELRAEVADVPLQYRGRVAARIDAHEEHADLRGLRSERTQRVGQSGECGRALIRTRGITEVEQHELVTVIGSRDGAAILIRQLELQGRNEAADVL